MPQYTLMHHILDQNKQVADNKTLPDEVVFHSTGALEAFFYFYKLLILEVLWKVQIIWLN